MSSWFKHALIPHPGNDHYPHLMRGPLLSVCTMLLAGSVTVAVYQTQLVKGGQYAAVVQVREAFTGVTLTGTTY